MPSSTPRPELLHRLGRLLFAAPAGDDEQADDRARWALVTVLFAAMALCLSLAMAATLPDLLEADEEAHLAYVDTVLDGSLPDVDEHMVPAGERFPAITTKLGLLYGEGADAPGENGDVWTANHPPLAYVVASAPAGLASAAGQQDLATSMPRIVNALGMALAVLAVVAVADALLPGRRDLAALAAALAATSPHLVGTGGLGLTDGVTLLVGTAALATALRIGRSGPTPRRFVALVATVSAGALTRSTLLPLVALAAVVWVATLLRQGRPGSAAAGAAALVVVPTLVAGWFYARNVDLYGSITGAGHLQDKFGREPTDGWLAVAAEPRYWLGLWQGYWGGLTGSTRLGSGTSRLGQPTAELGSSLVIGAAVVAAAAGGWSRLLRTRATWRRPEAADLVCWGVAATWVLAILAGATEFVAGGGTPHARYLLPAMPVIVVPLAVGLSAVRRQPPGAGTLVVAGLLVVDVGLLLSLRQLPELDRSSPTFQALGHPLGVDLLAPLLLIAGLALGVAAIVLLHRSTLGPAGPAGPVGPAQSRRTMPMRTACSTAWVRSRASSFW